MIMDKNNSFYIRLQCVGCGRSYDVNQLHTVCKNDDCKAILSAQYDFSAATLTKDILKDRPATLWRYK